MLFDPGTWYLSAVPVLVAVILSLAGNKRLNDTYRRLGGVVRTRSQLVVVRGSINQNKALAFAYLGLWILFTAVLAIAVVAGLTVFKGAVGHFLVFGLATLPFGLWSKKVEDRFRAMRVDSDDPSVEGTFARWLVEWKQPRLRVSEQQRDVIEPAAPDDNT
jgi:hypothetical protein